MPSPADLGPEPAQFSHLEKILVAVLNKAMVVATLAVFAMLVLAAFRYLTAGGDAKAMQTAKNTLTYAILGLVLMIVAWFILRFIGIFTGVEVTNFSLEF
jgi:heme/copper-type cytochrome/quinol oxidase subunit 2